MPWQATARMVAAYRDRYGITSVAPLGNEPVTTDTQAVDAARSAATLRQAARIRTAQARRPGANQLGQGIAM